MRDLMHLQEIELDALRELGNIGAGNAATALSKMLGEPITISVPEVKVVPMEAVPELLGGPDRVMAGIYMKVFGDAPCKLLCFFSEESVQSLLDLLLPAAGVRPEGLDENAQSALKELGNILGCAYLNAAAKLLNLSMIPSVPALAVDMVGVIMSEAVLDMAENSRHVIFIEARFEGRSDPVDGSILLVPEAEGAEALIARLHVLTGG
jgi:chemotaxis protein CheC